MSEKELLEAFEEQFGSKTGAKVYFAPGRVNLIGDHTDYNGGHVFPCALTIGTYAAARKRNDDKLRFFSANFKESGIIECSIHHLENKKEDDWANYPKGVIWTLLKEGFDISFGMDLFYYGNIPNSSGLSSSASIEVLTAYICKELFVLNFDMIECSKMCQFGENHFNGMNCGIMDQFAIAMGKKHKAIFLNTATLEYEYASLPLQGAKIVVMNTNKKRGLNDSKYNERRSECEEALRRLQKVCKIESLGELTEEAWECHKTVIQDKVLTQRAKHAVFENQRTIRAVQALETQDIQTFGRLMNESHNSLRDDYEVSCEELDTLVSEALKQEGVFGARMTGGGFGGCAVSIVKGDKIDSFLQNVGAAYEKQIGYKADFYIVEIGDGPRVLA